jgi:SAM-dependent methyltransferase
MKEPWLGAATRQAELDAIAVAYDTYRPRYPEPLFDTLTDIIGANSATVAEIGAGTGIATEPLIRRGFQVIAIEPAPAMAALLQTRLGSSVEVENVTFEDWKPTAPVDVIAAFTSWHWINPEAGVAKIASLLRPGGTVALTWFEVIQYGQDPFEPLSGYDKLHQPLAQAIEPSLKPFDRHGSFSERTIHRFRFERELDADTFIAESRTYPGPHTEERATAIRELIDRELGGTISSVQDAVLHVFTRI